MPATTEWENKFGPDDTSPASLAVVAMTTQAYQHPRHPPRKENKNIFTNFVIISVIVSQERGVMRLIDIFARYYEEIMS